MLDFYWDTALRSDRVIAVGDGLVACFADVDQFKQTHYGKDTEQYPGQYVSPAGEDIDDLPADQYKAHDKRSDFSRHRHK